MRRGLWGLPRKNNYKTHLLERPKSLGVGVGSLKAEEERVFLWEGCGGEKARQDHGAAELSSSGPQGLALGPKAGRSLAWAGSTRDKVSPFPSVRAPKLPLPHIKREGPDHPLSNWLEENVLGVFIVSLLGRNLEF